LRNVEQNNDREIGKNSFDLTQKQKIP
jgi:hypothetical protein